MGIFELANEGDEGSPVTHSGLQTGALNHTDFPYRPQALGCSGADVPLPWACEHWACNDQRAGQPSVSVSIVMGQLHYNVWSGTLGWSWNRLRDLIHSSSQAETETGQRNTQSSTCIILGGTKKAFLSRTVSAAQNVSFQHIIWNFINQLEFIFCKICKHKF